MKMKKNSTKDHNYYMKLALAEAKKAYKKEEVPIGAVVVDNNGAVIGKGYNLVESRETQSAHAEILAGTKAAKKREDWRLDGCWLYVTLEPCAMCMNFIQLSRMAGVVYGATSPLFGHELDKKGQAPLYKRDTFDVISGVADAESAELLKQFFLQKRRRTRERNQKSA